MKKLKRFNLNRWRSVLLCTQITFNQQYSKIFFELGDITKSVTSY